MDTTVLNYISDGKITGSTEVTWEESDIGVVTTRCPCGNLSDMLNINITRRCKGYFTSQATWDDPMQSSCAELDFTICSISKVRTILSK